MAAKEEKSKPTAEEQHEKHNQKAKENAAESRAKAKDKTDGEAKHVEKDDQKEKHNQKAKENTAESRPESKGKKDDHAKASKNDPAKAEKSHSENEIDEAQELDGLLEIFAAHDITEMDVEVAVGMIDEWYDILHKSKDESYKEVAANLKQLKKLLSGKKDQSEDVIELLDELGEQTDELANEAQRGYKGKLHKLGTAFRHAAQSIDEAIDVDDEEIEEDEEI
jgi:hypothetical protein